jgi:hypothetical protein
MVVVLMVEMSAAMVPHYAVLAHDYIRPALEHV